MKYEGVNYFSPENDEFHPKMTKFTQQISHIKDKLLPKNFTQNGPNFEFNAFACGFPGRCVTQSATY